MWNPGFEYDRSCQQPFTAIPQALHFSHVYRGTSEAPGLVLDLIAADRVGPRIPDRAVAGQHCSWGDLGPRNDLSRLCAAKTNCANC